MGRTNKNLEESIYLSRRLKLIRQIRGDVALFVNPAELTKSRDQSHSYQSGSDFFYLTGFNEPEAALVLSGAAQGPRSIIYLRERDAVFERWNGERLGIKRAKKLFRVDEVRNIDQLAQDLPQLLLHARSLHYTPGLHAEYDALIWKQFCTPLAPRLQQPNIFKDARLITSEMRFVKDRNEIRNLKHAADITARGFVQFLPHVGSMSSEKHAAETLESIFAKLGAHGLSFPTIVAAGKNATTLHHQPQLQPLWKRELVLIDAGASFRGYAGDITRTVPVSGKFSGPQADVYDLVHSAVTLAVGKAKPDVSLDDIHEAVVKHLTKGLVDLKVLKGSVADLISEGAYRKCFMHRTGHWLGIDVHDISPVTVTNAAGTSLHAPASMRPLVPGNAFTIEPGLYFDPRDTSIPVAFRGIGIRLEEDVLVTSSGCDVMTAALPIAREDIEQLMA